ncbi:hypothetical protein HJC23_006827 [Cyclotella cryptica]|uniref:Calcineurin-like phosphoesterase domain-containing protein n=1 Tax=Cyclotella cryptica TaxID=29204 RepID=A0ABD3NRY3_9STRA|eukprot:CCRYP_020123-RA/>CCRYP_020123-RA protein AED:0.00 eAED:0.00 QI:108/-1/1/1/-1/1/1/469/633
MSNSRPLNMLHRLLRTSHLPLWFLQLSLSASSLSPSHAFIDIVHLSSARPTPKTMSAHSSTANNLHGVSSPYESNSFTTTSHPPPFRIGYASDMEGHWSYFLDYVRRSNVLAWEEIPSNNPTLSTPFHRLTLRPDTHFVYGGDSVDKGPGDIRLCRVLVGLKRRYPSRVHLLVGNRDLNKLRFHSELSGDDWEFGGEASFWDPNAPSYMEYLRRREKRNTKVEKLKWILEHTLGCPDTFEFRREEVGILRRIYGCYPVDYTMKNDIDSTHLSVDWKREESIEVTDEQVVESFEYEINHPEGSLRQYLKHASIAAIIGNTIFVHGAIDALTMKYVPSLSSKFELPTTVPSSILAMSSTNPDEFDENDETMIDNVHEWVEALNEYLQRGLEDFEMRPHWNADRTSRGGEALLAIQNRPAMWGRSVVCNSYGDGGVVSTSDSQVQQRDALHASIIDSNPLVFEGVASNVLDPKPARWLLDHGIRRVVVGHKPTGDCPAVLSAAYTGVEVVSTDTSYSRRSDLDSACTFGECRGSAMSVVEIVGSEHANWLETFGTLACGTEYANRFSVISPESDTNQVDGDSDILGDMNLGKILPDGWWVKAAISPDQYHLCRGSGRFVEYQIRSKKDVNRQLDGL